ncbi:MAG: GNAT family N-acetyltransferase [Candidatus Promineofilum sp.]|nr:GNAT family N-acetyltransferase [Promineifilum sp.]
MMATYTMRTATKDEVGLMVDWAAAEGWNPGLYDAATFYAADPDGFLIGLLDDVPISSISVVRFGPTFAFLGFYIVKPEHRGHGYGLRLWNEGMKLLDGRDVGLDGVPAQESNYARWCFRLADRNTRYEGVATALLAEPAPGVVDLSTVPIRDLLAYDDAHLPAPRHGFLRAWSAQPQAVALALVESEGLAGYTVVRRCRSGYKFGPLFADGATQADALFRSAVSRLPAGAPFYLDTPGANPAAHELARRYDMKPGFQTARMYRMLTRPTIELPLACWFGVTSFELG